MLGLAYAAMLISGVAPEPDILPHIGGWQIDYDEDACHLSAQFGQDKDGILARFTRFAPSDDFELLLLGERVSAKETHVDVTLDFGAGAGAKISAAVGKAGKSRALVIGGARIDGWQYTINKVEEAPPISSQQEAAVKDLTVAIDRRPPFRLPLGAFEKPLAALRTCTDDLVRHWGYDPDVERQLSRKAKSREPIWKWLKPEDFPADALRAGANGIVHYRLDIDPVGRPTACRVLFRTDPDDFADTTCRLLMRRATFNPAIDAAGLPVRSFFVGQARWRSPD